jgi:hypothetical protein
MRINDFIELWQAPPTRRAILVRQKHGRQNDDYGNYLLQVVYLE